MDRMACTEPQCLYKSELYLYLDLCHIYHQSVGNGQMANVCTSECFSRRGRYIQVQNVSEVTKLNGGPAIKEAKSNPNLLSNKEKSHFKEGQP